MSKQRRYGLLDMYTAVTPGLVQDFFAHQYRDRGMKKWQGYYLSDHTSALNKMHQRYMHPEQPLSEQSTLYVTTILDEGFRNGREVTVQTRHVDTNGQLDEMFSGMVDGYEDNDVFIDGRRVAIDDIRHVWITLAGDPEVGGVRDGQAATG
ncbi:hypothetical protein [Lacticaseibacillus thailandensis]|nr:hypothetical protein [Lacticaseibacillus thailandensis]